ncbi:MAG TPA: autotransporter-associated beta strand repeat-containing protein [Gemmataceae bacterium]
MTAPAGPVSVGGNSFTLNTGFDLSAATQDLTVTLGNTNGAGLTLGANQTWNVATGRTLTVNAFISGTGLGITKTGNGTLSLPIMSNATGGYGNGATVTAMTILAGTVSVTDANNLGFANNIDTPKSLIIDGGTFQITASGNAMNANRGVALGANGGTIDTPTGVSLNINSAISDAVSGAGGLTKTGAGTLMLGVNTARVNTFTGPITVQAGVLGTNGRASAFGAATAGTTVMSGAAVQVAGAIDIAEPFTLNGTGVANDGALRKASGANNTTVNGAIILGSTSRINADVTTNALILNGGLTASGAGQNLTVGGAGNTTVGTTGINTGSGTLTKDGTGTLTLNAANAYTGTTTVSAGTLTIGPFGTLASKTIIVGDTVGSTAILDTTAVVGGLPIGPGVTLGGHGTVAGPVSVNGGTLSPGATPGILNMTGAVTMNSSSTLFVEINGPTTPGTDYDQVNLTGGGSIDLGGATLTGTFGYTPQSTDSITIITGGPVLNQFAGGTTFNFGGYTGTVSYPGNAVVLSGFTPVPEPGGVLLACGAVAGLAQWRRRRSR